MIYLLTAIGLSPGGSNTVHIYTQTNTERHKTNNTQNNTTIWQSASRARHGLIYPGICQGNSMKVTIMRCDICGWDGDV